MKELINLLFEVLFELTAHVAIDMPNLLVQHLEHSDNALALPGVRADSAPDRADRT